MKDEMIKLGEFGTFSKKTIMKNREKWNEYGEYHIPRFLDNMFDKKLEYWDECRQELLNKYIWLMKLADVVSYLRDLKYFDSEIEKIEKLQEKVKKIVNSKK